MDVILQYTVKVKHPSEANVFYFYWRKKSPGSGVRCQCVAYKKKRYEVFSLAGTSELHNSVEFHINSPYKVFVWPTVLNMFISVSSCVIVCSHSLSLKLHLPPSIDNLHNCLLWYGCLLKNCTRPPQTVVPCFLCFSTSLLYIEPVASHRSVYWRLFTELFVASDAK